MQLVQELDVGTVDVFRYGCIFYACRISSVPELNSPSLRKRSGLFDMTPQHEYASVEKVAQERKILTQVCTSSTVKVRNKSNFLLVVLTI